MNTLFLRLEGPLQSWGVRSRWGERDTLMEPTKSGVIGLLGCALGLRRDDEMLHALSRDIRMGVRVDVPGQRLRDYHSTGGATAEDGEPEGMLKADGKPKRETDISDRYYLADASFLVALMGEPATIDRLARAVQAPVWPVFLGRKSCPPSVPVFHSVGAYESLEAALKSVPLHKRTLELYQRTRRRRESSQDSLRVRLVLETRHGAGVRQHDHIGHAARRVFLPRFVMEQFWSPAAETAGATINTFE